MSDRLAVREHDARPVISREQPDSPPTLLIVSDDFHMITAMEVICDFLGLGVEQMTTNRDVTPMLQNFRPLAVMVEVDGAGQDGFNVMMNVAKIDKDMPVLLLTGKDPAMAGAADAIQEICGLTSVTKVPELPGVGEIVDFLFRAGRGGGWLRAMAV